MVSILQLNDLLILGLKGFKKLERKINYSVKTHMEKSTTFRQKGNICYNDPVQAPPSENAVKITIIFIYCTMISIFLLFIASEIKII